MPHHSTGEQGFCKLFLWSTSPGGSYLGQEAPFVGADDYCPNTSLSEFIKIQEEVSTGISKFLPEAMVKINYSFIENLLFVSGK